MTTALQLITFGFAIICRAIGELQQHNKLKWQNESSDWFGFWGRNSWVRKYHGKQINTAIFQNPKKRNWYYTFFKIKYKERWPTSATFTVFLTDGMHLMQFMFFNFLALSMTLAIGFDWWLLIWLLIGVRIVHAVTYRILSK